MSTLGGAAATAIGSGTAIDLPAVEQAADIVSLAAQLLRLKTRVSDLEALDEFSRALTGEIHEAIDGRGFCYHYQPIVSSTTGAVEGYEALLRWHRRGEAVEPALFLPIAEEIGAMQAIQQRLLDDVALAYASIPTAAFISINWSPRQFLRASAVSALIDRVRELKLDPKRIMIEITARATPVDPDLVYLCVELLKESGFQVALDDLGGHHGSLSYLSQLPIDLVKLDSSLIAGVEQSSRVRQILAAIIDFVHQLGLRVVAKGVQTQIQVRTLRRLGCDLLQGRLLGTPAREPQLIKADG
jgi:EAL domain-containing protein (putative c-di-GMP-specific phosphodiesterase class I)